MHKVAANARIGSHAKERNEGGRARKRYRRKGIVRAGARKEGNDASKDTLEAFFLGRALAELVVEQVGQAVGDTLSQVGTLVAERDERIVQFRKDVQERAREEMAKSVEETAPVEKTNVPELPPLNLDGAIQELRNEIQQAKKQLDEVRALDPKENDTA